MVEQPIAYAERYWHWRISVEDSSGEAREGFSLDQDFEALQTGLLEPWQGGTQFSVGGVLVRDKENVLEIQIVHTERNSKYIESNYKNRQLAKGFAGSSYDPRMLPFEFDNPPDLTNELLALSLDVQMLSPDVGLVARLCERLPLAHAPIRDRRKGKQPYEIRDEYDVHDLLLALIRGYIEGAVDEDPLSKVGGARAGRLDIGIASLGVLIEVKYVHSAADQKRLVEEFSEDLVLYPEWSHLEVLIFYVFNSRVLRDAEALRDLGGPQEVRGARFEVQIILV